MTSLLCCCFRGDWDKNIQRRRRLRYPCDSYAKKYLKWSRHHLWRECGFARATYTSRRVVEVRRVASNSIITGVRIYRRWRRRPTNSGRPTYWREQRKETKVTFAQHRHGYEKLVTSFSLPSTISVYLTFFIHYGGR